jgi:hypothetical protein
VGPIASHRARDGHILFGDRVAVHPQLLERGGEGDNGSGNIVLTSIISVIFVVENTEKPANHKLVSMWSWMGPE